MDAERDKREARNILLIHGTLQLFFGSSCMEWLTKKLGKTLVPKWRHILSQNKKYLL